MLEVGERDLVPWSAVGEDRSRVGAGAGTFTPLEPPLGTVARLPDMDELAGDFVFVL